MKKAVEKARKVKVIILDVDGILTDGGIFLGNKGLEIKKFNAQDGLGITLAKLSGIKVGIITGRESEPVKTRSEELKLDFLSQGYFDKRIPFEKLIKENDLKCEEIAYVGDDILDIPTLKLAGFSATAANGVPEVKQIVDYVADKKGGEGAVREIIEFILRSQDKWEDVTGKVLEKHER